MSNCINFKHPEVVKMAGELNIHPAVLAAKIGVWQEKNNIEDRFPTKEELNQPQEVNYGLKAIDLLTSDKGKQIFEKGKKNDWSLDKILTELQIPKEQKQLILDKEFRVLNNNDARLDNEPNLREQIITDLLANYSYTIEINTSKSKDKKLTNDFSGFRYGEYYYMYNNGKYFKDNSFEDDESNNIEISKEEYLEQKSLFESTNSNHYSNLTVPGGTNYTENEIATLAIIPSIKGHAQFATDNGIGWFRSDEKAVELSSQDAAINNKGHLTPFDNDYGKIPTKIRRILELQSDLFQKGRDKKDLIKIKGVTNEFNNEYNIDYKDFTLKGEKYILNNGKYSKSEIDVFGINENLNRKEIPQEEYDKAFEKYSSSVNPNKNKENQFLQLLNKDNNWVTFFVKSIIQDSVKKGYEKVLFPTGNTASKVEGHQTLEEFIGYREAVIRIKEGQILDEKIIYNKVKDKPEEYTNSVSNIDIAKQSLERQERLQREIDAFKRELENAQTNGLAALQPIAKFYEETVTNILKKQGYNSKVITDEHGNTWNEVELNEKRDTSTILFNKLLDENKKEEILNLDDNTTITNNKIDNTKSNKQLLFNSDEKLSHTVEEVLTNIINQEQNNLQPNFKILLDKARNIINNTKATVEIDTLENTSKRYDYVDSSVAMAYDANLNKIIIAQEALQSLNKKQTIESFIHEVVHAITHKVLKNPKTFEERELKEFLEKAFEQHKFVANERGGVKSDYGFTNIDEFVAEIYSNPEFQNELRKNKSFWQEFKDIIRRIFGLPKSLTNNDLIDATLIISRVTDFVENTNNSDFKGFSFEGDIYSPVMFKTVLKDKKEGYYDLNTIDKKITHVINRAKDILDQNINFYNAIGNKTKKGEQKDKFIKFSDKFKDTLKALENFDAAKQLEAISFYTKSLFDDINSLERSFDRKSFTEEEILKTISHYSKYLDSFTIAKDIQDLLADIKVDNKFGLSNDDIREMDETLKHVIGTYDSLKTEYNSYLKKALKITLSNIKYLPELETKWKEQLKKDYKVIPRTESEDVWIARQMNTTYKEDIKNDAETYVNTLIDSPAFDISSGTKFFNDSINTNSHLIQIFNQILNEVKEAINSQVREKEFELSNLFNKLAKEKGTEDVNKLYKNLIQQDKDGNYYLLSEHNLEFKDKLNKIDSEIEEILKTKTTSSKEFSIKSKEKFNLLKSIDKYKNKVTLSATEQEVLKTFKEIQDLVTDVTYGKQSKKKFVGNKKYNTYYYELPSITKSDLERVLSGDIKGTVKDKWTDLTTIKSDDVEFNYRTDNEYNVINNIPVRYSSKIEPKDQSLDLMTVYRLQYLNGINYKEKSKRERELSTITDIAKSKKYYKTQSGKEVLKSVFNKNNPQMLTTGENSNTYQRLQSLMEKNIYDIGHHYAGKFGPVDMNKAIGFMNGSLATIGLSLNRFAATQNILNAKAQMFLETLSKNVINKSNLAKAEALYTKELGNTMKDLGQPVEKSFINQMNRMFDTFGFDRNSMEAFIKKGVLKSYTNAGSLQFMHTAGEHWVQSVLTASVLDSIKVMDSDNNYINKDGKVVEKEKAASLLDMLYIDDQDGILKISDKVIYTTQSLTSKVDEGGKEKINQLIKKKIFDCFGNYDPNTQPEAMRHWWGKLFMMFRRFFVEMGTKRYMGFTNSLKSKDEIESDPEKYKHYSYALQNYEEGVYTSTMRYLAHGILPALKQMKFDIMSKEWNKLTDLEKGNIRYAVGEMIATSVLLPLTAMLLGAMLGGAGDGDDDKMIYFWLYQVSRMESELAQYRNPSANIKILRSPIPSMRIIENALHAVGKTINVFDWEEEYKSGPSKGKLKVIRSWEKLIPVLNNWNKDSEDLYNYQKSMFGLY